MATRTEVASLIGRATRAQPGGGGFELDLEVQVRLRVESRLECCTRTFSAGQHRRVLQSRLRLPDHLSPSRLRDRPGPAGAASA